jgi:ABC-2 type transport system permease protein
VSLFQAVVAKFLAAWIFIAVALALTFPIVITTYYLGDPDAGEIISGYLGSFLMAGAYLAIGCCVSALTKSQVISFIISVVICFVFMLAGFPMVTDFFVNWAPQWLVDSLTAISFSTHYNSIQRGVIDLIDIVFFASIIIGFLYASGLVLEYRKAD